MEECNETDEVGVLMQYTQEGQTCHENILPAAISEIRWRRGHQFFPEWYGGGVERIPNRSDETHRDIGDIEADR